MKPNIFPMKLWQLVHDGEISAIIWNSHGDGIIVKQNLIVSQVLSLKSFKAKAFTSFVRQLHMYGFRKSQIWTRDRPNIHEYFHPNFKRSQPDLLPLVKRHSGKYKCKVNLSTNVLPQPWMENKKVLQLPAKSYHAKVDRNPKALHHQYFNPAHTNMLQPNGFFFSGKHEFTRWIAPNLSFLVFLRRLQRCFEIAVCLALRVLAIHSLNISLQRTLVLGAETDGSPFLQFIYFLQDWQLSRATARGTSLSDCEGETSIHQGFKDGDSETREHLQHHQLWQQPPKQQRAKQPCFCSCGGHRHVDQRGGGNIVALIQERVHRVPVKKKGTQPLSQSSIYVPGSV